MIIDIEAFMVAQVILDVVLIAALCSVEIRTKRAERRVQLMTAKSDSVPTDPAIIEGWAAAKDRLPEGSPKWCAYRDRLESLGYYEEEAVVARRDLEGNPGL